MLAWFFYKRPSIKNRRKFVKTRSPQLCFVSESDVMDDMQGKGITCKGQKFTIIGTIRIDREDTPWFRHSLLGDDGIRRWLTVGEDPGTFVKLWQECTFEKAPVSSRMPDSFTVNDVTYVRVTRANLPYVILETEQTGRYTLAEYSFAPNEPRVLFENFGHGNWVVSQQIPEVHMHHLRLLKV